MLMDFDKRFFLNVRNTFDSWNAKCAAMGNLSFLPLIYTMNSVKVAIKMSRFKNLKHLSCKMAFWPLLAETLTFKYCAKCSLLLSLLEMDQVCSYLKPRFRVSEVVWRNGFRARWTMLFIIFCHIFSIFDDFLTWSVMKVLRNFEKSLNMPKKLTKNAEKSC